MANFIFKIADGAGNIYEVEAPEDTSDAALHNHVAGEIYAREREAQEAAIAAAYASNVPEAVPEETDFIDQIEEFGKGLVGGAAGLVEGAGLGAATLLDEENELALRKGIQAVGDFGEEYIYGADKGSEQLVGRKFGEALGSFGGIAAASLVNPFLGGALAIGAGAGEASERARAGGATEDERNLATLGGAGVGLTEMFPVGRAIRLFKSGVGKEAGEGILNAAGRVLREGGIEGAQEFLAGVGQNLIEQKIYNPDQGTFEGGAEQFGYGAGVGGFVRTVLEIITPRSRGGTPTEPTQGELFAPDADLGALPPVLDAGKERLEGRTAEQVVRSNPEILTMSDAEWNRYNPGTQDGPIYTNLGIPSEDVFFEVEELRNAAKGTQTDLFPQADESTLEDLGVAPERPDDRQLDLFDTPAAESEAEQLDFNAELDRQQATQQQAEAREREGYAAIERGDEAAFAQPDLFPEDVATARTVAEETAALRRIGNQEVTPGVTPTTETRDPRQTDLVDAVRTSEFLESEDNTLREMEAQEAAVRGESALETIGGQLGTQREQQTAQRRGEILDSVLTDLGTASRTNTAQRFSEALAEDGVSNTTPTQQEYSLINRATDSVAATRVEEGTALPVPPAPTRRQARAEREAQRRSPPATSAEPIITPAPEAEDPLTASATSSSSEIPDGPIVLTRESFVRPKPEPKPETETETEPETEPKPKPKTKTKTKPKTKTKTKPTAELFTGPIRTEAEIAEMERLSPYGYMSEINKEKLRTGKYNREEDIVPDKDPLNAQDKENITELLESGTTTRDLDGVSAIIYLGNFNTPIEGIAAAVYDVVYKTPLFSGREAGMSAEQRTRLGETYRGTGLKAGERTLVWVEKNLSPEINAWVAKEELRVANERQLELNLAEGPVKQRVSVLDIINVENDLRIQKIRESQDQINQEILEANAEEARKLRKQLNALNEDLQKRLLLKSNQVVGLDLPTHPSVRSALRQGNLLEALRFLAATSPSSRVSQVANKLAQVLGDTKVEVVENLTDEAGVSVAGLFDPKTNTVKVNAATGVNPHTILHETTHALTSATLANKSHTATKQLQKLFDDVKDQLGQQTLAGITPNANYIANGKPVNALQRFYRTIINFVRNKLGMDTKPITEALGQVDQFIEAMLAPAPQFREAGSLRLKASEIMAGFDRVTKSFPKATASYRKDFANRTHDFFSSASPARRLARSVLLQSAPLQALTDVAQRYSIKSAFKLHTTIQNMVGAQSMAEENVDGTLKVMQKWLKTAKDAQVESFNNLVYDSTTQQVDPTKPRDTYANNPEKFAAWKAMQADVKIVGPSGIGTYIELRESYRKQFEALRKVIESRINGLKDSNNEPLAEEAKEQLKTDIFDKIFAKGRIEPYFPLTRRGDNWLEYNTKVEAADGTTTTEPVYMAFKTVYERDQFVASLEGNPDVVGKPRPYKNIEDAVKGAQGSAPQSSFINDTMKLLAGVDQDVKDEFTQLFLNALPESSFAKSMVSRANQGKGRLGFDRDAESAFRYKAYNLASQIERMKYSNDIDDVMSELKKEAEAANRTETDTNKMSATSAVFSELALRAKFAKNPPTDKLASSLNRVAFVGTIGFNASSAIVNLSQIPLMFLPMLGGTYGFKGSTQAIAHAGRLIGGSGKSRKIATMLGGEADAKGMPSIDNYYQRITDNGNPTLKIRDDLNLDAAKRKELEDLMPLVELAASQGQLNRSIFYDTLGVEMSGREKGLWDYTNAMSAFAFHQVERFNRQVAMVSTYQLELARLRKKKGGMTDAAMQDAAAELAIYKAQEMNGGAFLATAPRIAQQKWGRVAMMYKTFGVQMYYTIMKTGKAAFSDADPEVRKQAMKALAGLMGTSVAMAGIQGLPMIGAFFAIANLFLDDDEEDAETIARKFMGEGFYKGGINALTGMDVASRFGLGNLLFRLNPYSQNQSAIEIAAQAVGGPALSVISQFTRGAADAADGNLQRGVETMLPSAFRNMAKTFRYSEMFGEGAIKSRRGDIIYDDISSGELMSQFFGFAPAGYTLQQEKNMSTKKIDRAVGKMRTAALKKLYIAIRMGDRDGFKEGMKAVSEFNSKHPSFPISGGTLLKSMRQHGKTSATMHNGITISPKMRGVLQQHRDEYWGQPDISLLRPSG